MRRWTAVGLISFAGVLAAGQMPVPQYATISAPSPRRNSCSIARTAGALGQQLKSLQASGTPQIDFAHQQIAVVATTSDGAATPSQMGPSVANNQTLVLTFKRGAAGNSGVFVFSVDANSAGGFTSCSVSYPPIPRVASSVSIK